MGIAEVPEKTIRAEKAVSSLDPDLIHTAQKYVDKDTYQRLMHELDRLYNSGAESEMEHTLRWSCRFLEPNHFLRTLIDRYEPVAYEAIINKDKGKHPFAYGHDNGSNETIRFLASRFEPKERDTYTNRPILHAIGDTTNTRNTYPDILSIYLDEGFYSDALKLIHGTLNNKDEQCLEDLLDDKSIIQDLKQSELDRLCDVFYKAGKNITTDAVRKLMDIQEIVNKQTRRRALHGGVDRGRARLLAEYAQPEDLESIAKRAVENKIGSVALWLLNKGFNVNKSDVDNQVFTRLIKESTPELTKEQRTKLNISRL